MDHFVWVEALHPSKQFLSHVRMCMLEYPSFMHERRVNIFYGHLVTCGKKKTMMSIFYWLAERQL